MNRKKLFHYSIFAVLLILAAGLIYASLGKKTERVVKEEPRIVDTEKQSNFDLSYISIYSNEETDIVLLDSFGNQVGEVFTQGPLVDPVTKQPAGLPTKNLLYSKPQNGAYSLKIIPQEKSNFWVEILLYDKKGEVLKKTIDEMNAGIMNLKINFDKNDVRNSTVE